MRAETAQEVRRRRRRKSEHLIKQTPFSCISVPPDHHRPVHASKGKPYRPFLFLTCLLKECTSAKALLEGRRAHFLAIWFCLDGDRYLGNLLLDMYGKCGYLQDARATFDKIVLRNCFSWNILISAYSGYGGGQGVLGLFRAMVGEGIQPDRCTFANVLVAVSTQGALPEGRHMHFALLHEGLEPDAHLESALLSMYGKCGSLEDAQKIFDSLSHKDGVSWNAMIAAYSMHGFDHEALYLYQKMPFHEVEYAKTTFLSSLVACTNLMVVMYGMLIHALLLEDGHHLDLHISTALVSMYSTCGSLEDARVIFEHMSQCDLVSLSAMISVNTQHGEDEEAFSLFSKLHQEGMTYDKVTLVSILGACANHAALAHGLLIHASALEFGIDFDFLVGNAFVNMYGKCGSLLNSKYVFDNMRLRNVISWTTMIEVYACVGHAAEAFKLFCKMQEENIVPNDVTFVNILSLCSRVGLIQEGCFLYGAMIRDYEIQLTMEHYSSMVDLFGRAGHLAEADFFISRMPIVPNAVIWETLLSACRVHNDWERGKQMAIRAILLDSKVSAPYVLLANIYSGEGKWDDAAKVWKLLFERDMRKSQKQEGGFDLHMLD